MAVTKHKDADWAYYLDQIVQSGGKVSESDMQEFSGFLFKRDMQDELNYQPFRVITMSDNSILSDKIIAYLIAESPETITDLLEELKRRVISFYKNEIIKLIELKMLANQIEEDGA